MKEFKIVNGIKIHPSFKKAVISGNKPTSSSLANKKIEFVPPRKLTLLRDVFDAKDFNLQTKPDLYRATKPFALGCLDYANEMSPIKDQKNLGSCVAFAAAAMKEWQEQREHKQEVKEGKRDHRQGKEYDYSEAWIYWNCKKIDPWPNEEGTSIRCAMQILNKIGVPTEKGWTYSDDTLNIGEPESWTHMIAKWALIETYYRVINSDQTKTSLINDGPFIMGIPCFYNFFFVGKDGIVPDPIPGETCYGGHAVCVVGYDDNKQLIKFKNSWGCYDDQTEVLTNNGFKYFKDISTDDTIATLNKKGVIKYHLPLNYIEYLYSGDMYEFKNTKLDLFVTPNHNMYLQTLRDRQEKQNNFSFTRAEDIKHKQIVFKRDGIWEGQEKDYFLIPSIVKKINKNKTKKTEPLKIKMDVWLEFLGYWLSEGHITKSKCKKGGNSYSIGISQTKKKNLLKIEECLKKLDFKFSYNGKCFSFQNQQLYTYLKQFGKCNKKYIPLDLKILNSRQLKILYNALMLGDGSIAKGKNNSNKVTYYTTSKKLADDFQEICLKIGYCSNIYLDDRVGQTNAQGRKRNFVIYCVKIQNTQNFNLSNTILNYNKSKNKKTYDGMVYCLEVPNHTLFIRRNGKTCWCGNSNWGKQGYGYISYDYFNNYSWDNWACRDIKVTKEMLKKS